MKATASGLLVCAVLCAAAPSVHASDDDRVIGRLTRYGELTPARAGKVARKVTKEMSRAAGMANEANDPVRVALSRAMFGGAPTPPDKMSEAKMRLRLYAGLNEWALERMFPPRPGVVGGCQRDFTLSAEECEALVAAAGRIALADAAQLGGGAATAVAFAGGASMQPAPAFSQAPARAAPASTGRFAKYDSGFRGGAARPTFTAPPPRPAPVFAAPAPRPAPAYAASAPRPAPAYAAPAPRPAPAYAAPAVDQRAAYKAQREAYLARQRAQMEERKAKMRAASGPEMRPKEEPAPAAPAAAKPATAAEPAAVAAADAPPAEAAPSAEQPKAALDNDFLDGLLADPLGNN